MQTNELLSKKNRPIFVLDAKADTAIRIRNIEVVNRNEEPKGRKIEPTVPFLLITI